VLGACGVLEADTRPPHATALLICSEYVSSHMPNTHKPHMRKVRGGLARACACGIFRHTSTARNGLSIFVMVKVSNHKSPRNPTWERDCVYRKSKEHPLNEMTTAGVVGRLTWRFRASGRYPRLKNGLEFFLFSPVESAVGMPARREAAWTLYVSGI
jgi:hypothetical protein